MTDCPHSTEASMTLDTLTSIETVLLNQLIGRAAALLARLEEQAERADRQQARIDAMLAQADYLAGGVQQLGELARKETSRIERHTAAIEQLVAEVSALRRTSDGVLDLSIGYDRVRQVVVDRPLKEVAAGNY
jgi:pyruvate dehydrogenase complex dehydrogenase (E1) component